ncbi:MAG: bifunctional (p)ppGpp synthetase/guanosine-3',5'-bis(diphosphate) 3'-pyrophosphohydrolase [Bdellovibrionales bacterium]
MMRIYELVERVRAYDASCDEDLLNRAYVFAMQAHGTQKRASGDPYFSHPLEVAGILTEIKLDSTAIATALLHDTVEDTCVTLDDIRETFGPSVARLVDGVTKLTRIEQQSDSSKQAENFRKLVLAMSEDIRVLLVKLADRLHNMRTLHYISNPEKRLRIAQETLEIYAPLAERIGIERIQNEIQDLAFAQINPDARDSIMARLGYLRAEGGSLVTEVVAELKKLLSQAGIKAKVEGREKRPYSIWRKMERKDISFEQLSDIVAFRIHVDTIEECYQALGVIHHFFPSIPGRFKDYISTPKPNKYQSIHTTILGPTNHRIEIQIRTHEMHEVAELGVAAHWAYKEGERSADGSQYRWLRELVDIVEQAQRPEEFLEHTKLELFQDQVFCFSPKGDLIALPRQATPVDFAYAVHSRVGDSCVGAKVNGRMVPLRTELRNGDQVEIITQKNGTPSPAWERFVVSGKARSRIRRFIRIQQRTEHIMLGKTTLEKMCRHEDVDFGEKPFEAVVPQFRVTSLEDLFANIGASLQAPREVLFAAYPELKDRKPAQEKKKIPGLDEDTRPKAREEQRSDAQTLKGLIPGMAVRFARCCHPLPGDEIVGIVSTGRGVTIHTHDCETLESFRDMPERWIDVSWGEGRGPDAAMEGRLEVVLANDENALGTLTTLISKNSGNITNIKITNRTIDFIELLLDVEVKDTEHLMRMVASLRAHKIVNAVVRAKGR